MKASPLIFAGFLGALAEPVIAAPGDLETGFGTSGKVITPLGAGGKGSAIAIQPDGKLVVVGTADQTSVRRAVVARYATDGTLDATFAGTGMILIHSHPTVLKAA